MVYGVRSQALAAAAAAGMVAAAAEVAVGAAVVGEVALQKAEGV